MKGEGTCTKAPDHAHEGSSHCVHARVRHGDLVCCWCGDLFVSDNEKVPGPHGQYKPRKRRPVDLNAFLKFKVGDRVQHTNSRREGYVRTLRDCPDGSTEMQVDIDFDDIWWNSRHVRNLTQRPGR